MGSVPQTAQENGTSVTKMSVPVTAEEKTNKKNDVKARSLLLMALLNEHQLTFSQYSDAKTILQKIVSRLAILGMVITQEDLNSKFLRSLPPEWNTHVVVWMNKADIETMSIDDLYNNFKIIEQDVKKSDLEKIHEDDLEAMDLKWQLSTEYEGKKVFQEKRWDTFPGNVEHQGTKRVNSEIKTTLGSKETMKTHLQRQCWDIDGVRLTGSVSQKNSGFSRHMTRNIAYLSDFKEFDGGYVAFGGGAYGSRITGKGILKTDSLDFEDVYFVNE
ncbi:hypothetical protein Tco_1066492 [Tanacetum coccineum]|uniref:Uncharacterized protein n=1 Tax=Tanacetum coccineum TaxID=301880 RepID=A0ABQ5HAR6_9ASTR